MNKDIAIHCFFFFSFRGIHNGILLQFTPVYFEDGGGYFEWVHNMVNSIKLKFAGKGDEIRYFNLEYKFDPETFKAVTQIGTTSMMKVSIPHSSPDLIMLYLFPVEQNVTLKIYMSEDEDQITPEHTRTSDMFLPNRFYGFEEKFLNIGLYLYCTILYVHA